MKKILVLSLAIMAISLISCQKHELETAGNIKGMGNTPGQLEVKEPFNLPQGILLEGDITGIEDIISKSKGSELSFDAKSDYSYFGSGKYVRLQINLINISNHAKTVFFPKGLLMQCNNGNSQHALLCQTTWFCIQPNTSRRIYLDLYCINEGVRAPDQNSTYKILGVSNSQVIGNLLKMIGWKKVNYEMIYGTFSRGKGIAETPTYEEITERLQEIIWNLTDKGIDITVEDKAFLESIPELSPEEIPSVDENSQFPEYFDEFIVPGK